MWSRMGCWSKDWVDPFVEAVTQIGLTNKLSFRVRGDSWVPLDTSLLMGDPFLSCREVSLESDFCDQEPQGE